MIARHTENCLLQTAIATDYASDMKTSSGTLTIFSFHLRAQRRSGYPCDGTRTLCSNDELNSKFLIKANSDISVP